ncbi:hypothetical protein AMAG_05025 [Allomyces macrogynus ATCC 38327]|uniref:U2A'/phosphoprotein 32 family A C-terminal domain-containing protein n=1 Tax=Allomyces macrogynus (strain ATCC 38327) TaxID=578462 RepID=A0A0L0S7A3_ALLM3|nr:hypothetical protein AMAG_05025 [Allomyces macrogynus ATCC 38327]|eukprot:KNE58214.1 hypothetical protein AMAG_05025 [Allomyces macrogynus ATCC 38327]
MTSSTMRPSSRPLAPPRPADQPSLSTTSPSTASSSARLVSANPSSTTTAAPALQLPPLPHPNATVVASQGALNTARTTSSDMNSPPPSSLLGGSSARRAMPTGAPTSAAANNALRFQPLATGYSASHGALGAAPPASPAPAQRRVPAVPSMLSPAPSMLNYGRQPSAGAVPAGSSAALNSGILNYRAPTSGTASSSPHSSSPHSSPTAGRRGSPVGMLENAPRSSPTSTAAPSVLFSGPSTPTAPRRGSGAGTTPIQPSGLRRDSIKSAQPPPLQTPVVSVPEVVAATVRLESGATEATNGGGPKGITRDLIIAKNVSKVDQQLGDIDKQLQVLTHVRLDRSGIESLHGLVQFTQITNLYLQHNNLTTTEGLAALPHLRFLTLSHNRLSLIRDLDRLPRLVLLDLSHNQIAAPFPVAELPSSLVFLDTSHNPASRSGLGAAVFAQCPHLEELDGHVVTQANAGFHDKADDDADLFSYLVYSRSRARAGTPSVAALDTEGGAAAAIIDKGLDVPDDDAVDAADPDVLVIRSFSLADVKREVGAAARRAAGAQDEYRRRVQQVKEKFGFAAMAEMAGRPVGDTPAVAATPPALPGLGR